MISLEGFDLGVLYFFGSLHRPWLNSLALRLTELGSFRWLLALVGAWAVMFLLFQRFRFALLLLAILVSSIALEWGGKWFVNRARPEVEWRLISVPQQPSFPSGHALRSVAVLVGGALLTSHLFRNRSLAVLLVTVCTILALAIGLTRPYLGVHYPLDVFAGWVGGLACAFIGVSFADSSALTEMGGSIPPQSPPESETNLAPPAE